MSRDLGCLDLRIPDKIEHAIANARRWFMSASRRCVQVEQHRESTRLQYGLADRACRLGWRREQILVIDDDLGRSAASALNRPGFQRLVAEVGLGHVGLVLGIEVSRLARSCRDWHQLLEMCALRHPDRRRGRHLRPQHLQRPPAVRPQGHHERGGVAHPQGAHA